MLIEHEGNEVESPISGKRYLPKDEFSRGISSAKFKGGSVHKERKPGEQISLSDEGK